MFLLKLAYATLPPLIDPKKVEPCVTCPFYRNDSSGEPVCGILADCPEPTDRRKAEGSLICDQGKMGEYAVATIVRRTAATQASRHERMTPSLIPPNCLAGQINEVAGMRYMPRHIKLLQAMQTVISR